MLDNNSVDISITSPPYNVHSGKYKDYNDNLKVDEYSSWLKEIITEMIRVTKYYIFFNIQFLTSNKISFFELINHFRDNIVEIIIWKKSGAPSSNDGVLTCGYEFIICFGKQENCIGRKFVYPVRDHNKFVTYNILEGKNNAHYNVERFIVDIHSAIFPIYMPRWIIKNFSNINDVVLDPFMGTGTTALACKQLNRRYIGFDINKDYVEISNKRLEQQILANLEVDWNERYIKNNEGFYDGQREM